MGNLIIINGSPRAAKSNSKRYGEIFTSYYKEGTDTFNINKTNHIEVGRRIGEYKEVLFIFPLYVDAIPATFLNFLKSLEENPPRHKPTINLIVNCGFIEPAQNNVCIDMIKLFCKQNGYNFGSVLSIGGGEAILDTPFKVFAKLKIKALANVISSGKNESLSVTMPLTKKLYLKASTSYWINYGKRFGISKDDMEVMEIEKNS